MACSQLEAVGPGLGHLAAHLGLGGHQVGFGRRHGGFLDLDLNLVRLLVELDQQVALFHAVVVIHQDLGHLARHPGGDEGHVAVDVGVIGGNRVQRRDHPGHQEVGPDRQADHDHRQDQPFSQGVRRRAVFRGGGPGGGLLLGAGCGSAGAA